MLLEPYYDFVLEVPAENVGRAMTDMSQKEAEVSSPQLHGDTAVLKGRGPVSTLWDYAGELAAYTKGEGHLSCVTGGYGPCHNAQEVIEQNGYDPEEDMANPTRLCFLQSWLRFLCGMGQSAGIYACGKCAGSGFGCGV